MKRLLCVVAFLSLSACVHTQQSRSLVAWNDDADVVVFRDVRVFPATGPDALEHHDVVVRGKVIVAVRPTGEPVPAGARVFDGAGRTLLPGLVDAHAHAFVIGAPPWYLVWPEPEHVLQELLYAGTTTYHDLAAPIDDVMALKKKVDDGVVLGPTMLPAGPVLTATNGYPESMTQRILPGAINAHRIRGRYDREVDDVKSAVAVVNELLDKGALVIKCGVADTPDGAPVLKPEVLDAITRTAHARGVRVVAHIDTAKMARYAVDHGVDALVHNVHSSALTVEDAQYLKAKGTVVVATLLTFERLDELRRQQVTFSKIEKESIPVDVQHALQNQPKDYALDDTLMQWLAHLDTHRDDRLVTNVQNLRDAGVPILVGTDGNGSDGSFAGGIHLEMQLLAKAGVSNSEILLGATSRSAHLVLQNPRFGTVEAGKAADLLLVDGNPLEDIAATQNIVAVVKSGRVIKRFPPPVAAEAK